MIIYFHYLVNFRPTGGLDPAEYDIVHITSSLKELQNRILRTVFLRSLFRLICVYVGLHFLQFLLEN